MILFENIIFTFILFWNENVLRVPEYFQSVFWPLLVYKWMVIWQFF